MAKTILITGASSGLGAEMARQFADRGYDLALCARRIDRLEDLKADLLERHPGCRIAVRALDVTDDEAVFTVFRSFAEELGTIDRVVVNAGLGKGAPLGTGRYEANRETAVTKAGAPLSMARPLRWQRSSAASFVTNGGCHRGTKLWRSLIVARQENSVLTKTTRPLPSTITSCASTSPVVHASRGT